MPEPEAPVFAAVDAGSNSVHLLVATVRGHDLGSLIDESSFIGLGAAVGANGRVGSETGRALVEVLARYADIARGLAAGAIVFLGTEPLRRASDASEVTEEVEAAVGLPLTILEQEEEAFLTALGVTGGHRAVGSQLIVDIGGGSTEFVVVSPDAMPAAWGLPVGSARLAHALVHHDPPTAGEIAALRGSARAALAGARTFEADRVVAVGGTASNLAKVVPDIPPDGRLTRARLESVFSGLSAEPAASFAARYAINPRRAPLLPAGAAILEAILERLGRDELHVSDASMREGAVLALGRAGEGWRASLPELVRGWVD